MIPERLEIVTVDDLVRSGTCRDGVLKIRDKLVPLSTCADVSMLSRGLSSENRHYLNRAAGLEGSGSGSGSGSGLRSNPLNRLCSPIISKCFTRII